MGEIGVLAGITDLGLKTKRFVGQLVLADLDKSDGELGVLM